MDWKCTKCENTEFEKGQIQTTGGNFSKLFDIQNKNQSNNRKTQKH